MTGSAPPAASPARPGQTEYGRIDISDTVVAKLAARAAAEVPDAGSAAPRMLGRSLGDAPHAPGVRRTSLTAHPKTSARVDGSVARLHLVISVRWPAPVARVCEAVRRHVADRVSELTGLSITDIGIDVTDLAAPSSPVRAHRREG